MTIKEIAQIANVSRTTVSRVLNNKWDVNEETRQKVLDVIKQFNYYPSIHAKRNILKKINIIGLVLINSLENVFISALNSEIIKGLLTKATELGFDITICSNTTTENLVSMYLEKRFDGYIILNPNNMSIEMLRTLKNKGIPFVATSFCGEKDEFNSVDIDNTEAGYLAADYLIANCHKDIALITGPEYLSATHLRLTGCMQRLRKQNIVMPKEYIRKGSNTMESGYYCMKELLELSNRPTAIFAFNDYMAFGAMRAIKEHGLKVAEDISIIGFDDVMPANFIDQPLTTMRQSGYLRGYKACANLISILNGGDVLKTEYVNHEIIVRSTVKSL